MRISEPQTMWQALSCFLCIAFVFRSLNGLDGSEFKAGKVTGPLLNAIEIGILLFLLAFCLTFFYRRAAAASGMTAAFLCLPLYLYFVAPGPFRWMFPGEYSVPVACNFVWSSGPVIGIAILLVTVWVCLRSLAEQTRNLTAPHKAADKHSHSAEWPVRTRGFP
jgi:hypothetical protein